MLSSSLLLASSLLLYGAKAQSVDSQIITIPQNLGAKTDFGNAAMRTLLESFPSRLDFASSPKHDITTIQEPTCSARFIYCSTTFFGETLTLVDVDKATYGVVWHQDVNPSACQSSKGCDITSAKATADLTSQTSGWEISLTLSGNIGISNPAPSINGGGSAGVTAKYSSSQTQSNTVTTTKTYKGTCDPQNECFLETGTVFLDIEGSCTSEPLMICDAPIHPCDDMATYSNACSQYSTFTNNHCTPDGKSKNAAQRCSMRVAISQSDGSPLALQVFEEIPVGNVKREATDPFGTLGDGSKGAWIPFEQS